MAECSQNPGPASKRGQLCKAARGKSPSRRCDCTFRVRNRAARALVQRKLLLQDSSLKDKPGVHMKLSTRCWLISSKASTYTSLDGIFFYIFKILGCYPEVCLCPQKRQNSSARLMPECRTCGLEATLVLQCSALEVRQRWRIFSSSPATEQPGHVVKIPVFRGRLLNGSETVLERVRQGRQRGSKTVPERFPNGSRAVPGGQSAPKRFPNGSPTVPKRFPSGSGQSSKAFLLLLLRELPNGSRAAPHHTPPDPCT